MKINSALLLMKINKKIGLSEFEVKCTETEDQRCKVDLFSRCHGFRVVVV